MNNNRKIKLDLRNLEGLDPLKYDLDTVAKLESDISGFEAPSRILFETGFHEVRKKNNAETRIDAISEALKKMDSNEPSLIVRSTQNDVMPVNTSSGLAFPDLMEVVTLAAENSGKYDFVVVYDPTTNSLHFADELSKNLKPTKTGVRSREAINQPEIVIKDSAGNNLVPLFLAEDNIRNSTSSNPDRFTLQFVKAVITEKKSKVCLIIENAHTFFANANRGTASMERFSGEGLIMDFHRFLIQNPNNHLILIDREGEVPVSLQSRFLVHDVSVATRAELFKLLKGQVSPDAMESTLKDAKGMTIRDARRIVKDAKNETTISETIRTIRTASIAARTKGAVVCEVQPYTPEMVHMPAEEMLFWNELAYAFKNKPDLLPQGALLVGPPGTGKSVRGRYLATLMDVPYLRLDDISSSGWRGVKEDKIRRAFRAAMDLKPCVLFIDEMDKLFPTTEGIQHSSTADNDDAEVAGYIQATLDSAEMRHVVVIGAANNPSRMNEALLRSGRFGLRLGILPPFTIEDQVSVFNAVKEQVRELRGVKIDTSAIIATLSLIPSATGADYFDLLQRAALKWRISGGNQGFEPILLANAKTFKFRINSNIKEMIQIAIDMHTAPYSLFAGSETESESSGGEIIDMEARTLAQKLEDGIARTTEERTKLQQLILSTSASGKNSAGESVEELHRADSDTVIELHRRIIEENTRTYKQELEEARAIAVSDAMKEFEKREKDHAKNLKDAESTHQASLDVMSATERQMQEARLASITAQLDESKEIMRQVAEAIKSHGGTTMKVKGSTSLAMASHDLPHEQWLDRLTLNIETGLTLLSSFNITSFDLAMPTELEVKNAIRQTVTLAEIGKLRELTDPSILIVPIMMTASDRYKKIFWKQDGMIVGVDHDLHYDGGFNNLGEEVGRDPLDSNIFKYEYIITEASTTRNVTGSAEFNKTGLSTRGRIETFDQYYAGTNIKGMTIPDYFVLWLHWLQKGQSGDHCTSNDPPTLLNGVHMKSPGMMVRGHHFDMLNDAMSKWGIMIRLAAILQDGFANEFHLRPTLRGVIKPAPIQGR